MSEQEVVQTTIKPTITSVANGFLQRAAVNNSPTSEVPPIVHEVLNSPGQPLDAQTRAFMEPRFGHDFSSVRVHNDTRAARSARAVSALAYTVGNDIVFGKGQYAPRTAIGQKLISHELTHVIQQSGTGISGRSATLVIGSPSSALEQEAEVLSKEINRGQMTASISQANVLLLQRWVDPAYRERLDGMSDQDLNQELQDVVATLNDLPPATLEWSDTVEQQQVILDVLANRGFPVANPGTRGRSRVAQRIAEQHRQQLQHPFQEYVDNFQQVTYDLFDPPGPNLSKILRVHYNDGTIISINIDDIGDEATVLASEAIADDFFYVGDGDRTFPRRMNMGTTPNLWAAKREALIEMDQYNVEFITLSITAVMLVISPPTIGGGGGVSVRRVPRLQGGRSGTGSQGQTETPRPPSPSSQPAPQRQTTRVPTTGTAGSQRASVRTQTQRAQGGERGPRPQSPGPWRGNPVIQDGNLKEGWIHIEARHVTGTHPTGAGDLFARGTTRSQLQGAARQIVGRGRRISDPSRQIQTFERRITINGQSDNVRVIVDTADGRVITMFPVRGG